LANCGITGTVYNWFKDDLYNRKQDIIHFHLFKTTKGQMAASISAFLV